MMLSSCSGWWGFDHILTAICFDHSISVCAWLCKNVVNMMSYWNQCLSFFDVMITFLYWFAEILIWRLCHNIETILSVMIYLAHGKMFLDNTLTAQYWEFRQLFLPNLIHTNPDIRRRCLFATLITNFFEKTFSRDWKHF